ncbi:MAG: ferric reductase-like transmembrane domain-containing protein [Candidatus Kapabacteria bacterium]|nr:ferric reductase-like transmembrane domain-containing protein [Candidatus Kapabacteria bacterium]
MIASFAKLTLIVISIIAIAAIYFYIVADKSHFEGSFFINLNKTLAVSGALCIIVSLSLSTIRKIGIKFNQSINFFIKHLGLIGFYIASLHILFSLMLLNSKNHPYLFDVDLQLNLGGQMTVLFGAISFGIFLLPAITSISAVKNGMSKEKWKSVQGLSYFGIASVSVHLLFISFERYAFAADNNIKFNFEPLVLTVIILIMLFLRIITIFLKKTKKEN